MADLGTPTRFGTVWVIVVASAALIGWDIYAACSPTQPTISALALVFAHKHPVVPFLLGVVMGHIFWPQEEPTE